MPEHIAKPVARYFVIRLQIHTAALRKLSVNTQIRSRRYELSILVEIIRMHACVLILYFSRSQCFPRAKRYPCNERKGLKLNRFIGVCFHAPTVHDNRTHQPVHICMHKTE